MPLLLIVAIVLQANLGAAVSSTETKAPAAARRLFENGEAQLEKRNWSKAEAAFTKAVELYADYAAAWSEMGIALENLRRREEALKSFQKAIAADPHFMPAYEHLASALASNRQWDAVADITGRAIAMNPVDMPDLFLYNAFASFNLAHYDQAEQSARKVLELDTKHHLARAEYVLGMTLAQKHNYTEAVGHLRRYLDLSPDANDSYQIYAEIKDLETKAR